MTPSSVRPFWLLCFTPLQKGASGSGCRDGGGQAGKGRVQWKEQRKERPAGKHARRKRSRRGRPARAAEAHTKLMNPPPLFQADSAAGMRAAGEHGEGQGTALADHPCCSACAKCAPWWPPISRSPEGPLRSSAVTAPPPQCGARRCHCAELPLTLVIRPGAREDVTQGGVDLDKGVVGLRGRRSTGTPAVSDGLPPWPAHVSHAAPRSLP